MSSTERNSKRRRTTSSSGGASVSAAASAGGQHVDRDEHDVDDNDHHRHHHRHEQQQLLQDKEEEEQQEQPSNTKIRTTTFHGDDWRCSSCFLWNPTRQSRCRRCKKSVNTETTILGYRHQQEDDDNGGKQDSRRSDDDDGNEAKKNKNLSKPTTSSIEKDHPARISSSRSTANTASHHRHLHHRQGTGGSTKKKQDSSKWPPNFVATNGAGYKLDNQSGMFFEPQSDFYYDPGTKLYYGIQQKAYFKYNPRESPPFEKVVQHPFAEDTGKTDDASQDKATDTRREDTTASNKTAKHGDSVTEDGSRISASSSVRPAPPHLNATQKQDRKNIAMWGKMQHDARIGDGQGEQQLPLPATIVVKAKADDDETNVSHDKSIGDSVGKGKQNVNDAVDYNNGDKVEIIACYLCRRKFKSFSALEAHKQRSKMHQENLKRGLSSTPDVPSMQLTSGGSTSNSSSGTAIKKSQDSNPVDATSIAFTFSSHSSEGSKTGNQKHSQQSQSSSGSTGGTGKSSQVYQDRAKKRRAMHQRSSGQSSSGQSPSRAVHPRQSEGVDESANEEAEKVPHSEDKQNVGYKLFHKMLDKSASSTATSRTTCTGASTARSSQHDLKAADGDGSGDATAKEDSAATSNDQISIGNAEVDEKARGRKEYLAASSAASHKRLRADWDDMQTYIDNVNMEDNEDDTRN